MRKLDGFFESESERIGRAEAPDSYDNVLTEAFVAAGLSKEEIEAVMNAGGEQAEREAAGLSEARPVLRKIEPAKGKAAGRDSRGNGGAKGSRRKLYWIPAIAACVALLLIATSILPLGSNLTMLDSLPASFQGAITVAPLAASDSGIDREKGFVITSTEPLAEEVVEKALVIEPAISYTLEKKKGGSEYLVLPDEPLASGSVYKISFDPQNSLADQEARAGYTWAFQTAAEFELRSVLPSGYSGNVPLNTAFTLTFSRQPEQKSLENLVRISPSTAGEWRIDGDRASFVPAEPLLASSTYEIVVDGGVKAAGEDIYLGRETRVVFRTEVAELPADTWILNISNESIALRPDERPVVRLNAYHTDREKSDPETLDIDVKLYQYDDGNDFAGALAKQTGLSSWMYEIASEPLPTHGLKEAASFTAACPKIDGGWYVTYPENLKKGFYLAEYSLEGVSRQQLIQVTCLSAYLAANDEEALIWVNDLAAGKPAEGAALAAGGLPSGVTDSQGLAYIAKLPEDQEPMIITVNSGGELLYVKSGYGYDGYTYSYRWENRENISQDYWYYLSADKPLYHPGESVRLFGLAAPRTEDARDLDKVTVKLSLSESDSEISKAFVLEEGALSGEFPMPVLRPGYYQLEMLYGEDYICSTYIEVATYEKAAYQINFAADKEGVMAGDAITWTAETSFFDGTPLPDQPVTFSGDGIKNDTTITSDLNGEIKFTTRAEGDNSGYLISSNYVSAEAVLPEIGDTYRYQWARVLNSDLDISGRAYRQETDSRTFNAELELFTISADLVEDWSDTNAITAQARQDYEGVLELRAEVTRQYWEKVQTGQKLDPYTNLVEPVYEYVYHSVDEPEIRWRFDGTGQATFSGKLESEDSYRIRIHAKDRRGREFYRDFYIPPTENGTRNDDSEYIWLQRDGDANEVKIGEKVDYKFYSQDAPLISEGYCLFFTSGDKIRDYQVSRENSFQVQFTEDDIPGLNVSGVYFDGESYSSVAYATTLIMDTDERSLNLKITADKESYSPGELVTMELLLTDSQGNPRSGTVNLNVLDEALLAISDSAVDMADSVFLGNLYSFDYSFAIMNGDSILGPMAEGGGDGEYRENFQDSALFTTVKTDSRGLARVSFTLPDNITSWRAIWQAYVPDIWVGSGSVNVIAGLPFFADIRFNGPILAGDKAVLGVRAAGAGIGDGARSVAWRISIPEAEYTNQVSGPAYSWKELELPALEAGEYTLLVEASCLSYTDAVKQSFQVKETQQSHQASSQTILGDATTVKGAESGLTKLIFSDTKRGQSLKGLLSLAGQQTIRLEQRIAALKARELLSSTFGYEELIYSAEEAQTEKEAILNYQKEDGGAAYLPYGSSDLRTSVWAASLGGEYFSKSHLAAYFSSLLESGAEDPTMALWGLAVSGKPVLGEMRQALENGSYQGNPLSGQQKLNLACGLLFAGDGNYAKPHVEKLIGEWTEDLGDARRATVSDDRQEIIQATAQLAAAAGLLELDTAEGLYAYVLANPSQEDPCLLEQLAYLQGASRRLPEDSGFTYSLEGKTETVSLTKSPVYTLSLTPTQLASIKFSQTQGEITLTTVYEAPGKPAEASAASRGLAISRSYQVSGRSTTSLPTAGKIQVVIDYSIAESAPDGYYEIVDYLPAGLRYVNMTDDAENHRISLMSEKGNQLTFCLSKSGKALSGQLKFYVRVAMPGAYLAEPATLSPVGQPTTYAVTPETRVYIN